ncbi:MAG: glycosyltransferase [Desulfarculus sp.]|nr:glycosyltransferase [Desulfarculus sp.]
MPEPSLGLIMILRDEAANLERSLAPVARCFDEVVVVDTGSRDQTPSLCAQMGARVTHMPWQDDFATARNRSIEEARADWLFWLDGDNAITPEDVSALRMIITKTGPAVVWAQEMVVPSGQRLWQKRCFPRHPQVRFQGLVHEQLTHPPAWPALVAPVVVRHWGYHDPARAAQKGRYYLQLLARIIAQDPEDFYALWQAARCHYNLRQFEDAARYLERMAALPEARRQNPELWASGHHLWSQALERLGRFAQAEGILNLLLDVMPWHGPSQYQRGRLAYARQDWPRAVKHLMLALNCGLGVPLVDLDPHKTMFLAEYFLGRSLERLGQPAEAAAALRRAIGREPQNVAARNDLARLLAGQGQRQEAQEHLEHVLKMRPQDRQAQALWAAMGG